MTNTRVLSNQRITVWLGPSSGIADYTQPTLAEVTALTNVSEAISWNNFAFNVNASTLEDDRSLTDAAGAKSRSYSQFGGIIGFFTPKPGDTTSIYRVARNIVKGRSDLAMVIRTVTLNTAGAAAGDEINAYHVTTDAKVEKRGKASYTYDIKFVPKDDVGVNAIIPAASPTPVTITPSTSVTGTVGGFEFVTASYEGRNVTVGATYLSSDESIVKATKHGVIQYVGAGTATITPSYPGSSAGTPKSYTIS